jgi:ribonuclease HII
MKVKVSEDELLNYEKELYKKGYKLIGGVDEAGRGPLVGPVVAACVILPINYSCPGLNDSKQLTEKKREKLYDIIMKDAISVGVGVVDNKKIDEINILEASRLAMKLAIDNMDIKPDYVLSDAMKLTNIDIPYQDIIHGDALSLSIAAGSVIAKVTRDRMMYELDKKYPEYGFAKHKGYPTKLHMENLKKYGVLDIYRFTYKPVSDLINNDKRE